MWAEERGTYNAPARQQRDESQTPSSKPNRLDLSCALGSGRSLSPDRSTGEVTDSAFKRYLGAHRNRQYADGVMQIHADTCSTPLAATSLGTYGRHPAEGSGD